jgi:hypothetical protein
VLSRHGARKLIHPLIFCSWGHSLSGSPALFCIGQYPSKPENALRQTDVVTCADSWFIARAPFQSEGRVPRRGGGLFRSSGTMWQCLETFLIVTTGE